MSYTSGPFALHAQQVLLEDRASRPNNTRLSYNNRVKEFIQFCEAKYSSESPAQSASTVTEEKLFGFLHFRLLFLTAAYTFTSCITARCC